MLKAKLIEPKQIGSNKDIYNQLNPTSLNDIDGLAPSPEDILIMIENLKKGDRKKIERLLTN